MEYRNYKFKLAATLEKLSNIKCDMDIYVVQAMIIQK